ncbi:MAG TPA: hypothetical protein VEC93_08535, partial [Anaerolineae bacterium]|nr:hypothetical protein [Anaerolineae bacterium]
IPASEIPGCGDCAELKPTQDIPNELLAERVAAVYTKIIPDELLGQRASGCASCEDEGDPNE